MKGILIILIFYIGCGYTYADDNYCIRFNESYSLFPSSRILQPSKEITVECWMKVEKYRKWAAPVSYIVDNKYNESGFALAFNEGKMRFLIKTDEMRSQDRNFNPGTKINLNQWCHIAGVYDGKSIRFYLDGVLKEEKYVSGNIDWQYQPEHLCVGAFLDSNELHYFDGCIDEVRIWNRSLSAGQIKKGMNVSLAGDEEGLILYLPMNEGKRVVEDHSINNFDGEIVNYSNESRIVSYAMVRPEITQITELSTSSFQMEWVNAKSGEFIDLNYIDLAKDEKFNTLMDGFTAIKVHGNGHVFKDMPGGNRIYARVKTQLKNGDFLAYSEPVQLDNFATSLTVDLIAKSADDSKHFFIVDNNVLATNLYKFEAGVKSLSLRSVVASNMLQGDSYATLHIEGKGLNQVYEINDVSNLIFPHMQAGIYNVIITWGTKGKQKLQTKFQIEIAKIWWENIWFQFIVLIVLGIVLYLLHLHYKVISRKNYAVLREGYLLMPDKDQSMSDEDKDKYYDMLIELMENEKPYLDHRISIKKLGELLNVSPQVLSKLIFDKNGIYYNDFINRYRIEEAKQVLRNKDKANLKIQYVAENAGFNSESTFFRVFKKFTGETPSSYQKKQR